VATDARERLIADSQFGAGNIIVATIHYAPATWFLGLSKTTPNEDGSNFTEPVGLGYGRVSVANDAASAKFGAAVTSAGVTTKANAAKFTYANPSGLWGLLLEYGWFTALTGGIPEYTHPLDVPITVQSGNTPVEFDVGQLVMVWD
jgi:hypothetical protein